MGGRVMTASERILQKTLVTSGIGADEWNSIQAGLRDRAFFSARVTEIRILDVMRGSIEKSLSGNLSPSEFRKAVRETLFKTGYDAGDARGTIKDLMTKSRLDLVYNTNREMAQGFIQHLQATSEGALAAFPAYELIRAERRKVPRNWPEIWKSKGGTLYQGGRMIALKTDPIWTRISRFGIPHPPFDYNSGMDLVSVSRGECLALGVIDEKTPKQKPPKLDFNENLQATVPYKGPHDKTWEKLVEDFQDQITHDKGKIVWRAGLVRDAFNSGKPFEIRLGTATGKLRSMLPPEARSKMKSKSLTIKSEWLDKPRKDGTTHRQHFKPLESDPRNIPLTDGDFDLVPTLWRDPDRVSPGDFPGSFICELETFDGGILKMVVDVKRTPVMHTLYKNKPGMGLGASIEQSSPSQGMRHVQQAGMTI